MMLIRILVSDSRGNLFETETEVTLDASIESRLTKMCEAMIAERFKVLRIGLSQPFMTYMQKYLIPSSKGRVMIMVRMPVA